MRINVELDENNHIYLKTLAGATGKSFKVLVNGIIATFINEHSDLLDKASDLDKSIKKALPLIENTESKGA